MGMGVTELITARTAFKREKKRKIPVPFPPLHEERSQRPDNGPCHPCTGFSDSAASPKIAKNKFKNAEGASLPA